MSVVDDKVLADVLSEFARTVVTESAVQGVLDHLVERIADVLPVASAGVTLISDAMRPHDIAASSEGALTFERLQTNLQEGPCLVAYRSGEPVLVPNLRNQAGFSRFRPPALEAGLRSVFAFPLRHGMKRLGALDLYGDQPLVLDARQIDVAQDLADVAAAFVLNAQAREESRVALEMFQHDPLTGLANRVLLQERLEHALERAQRWHTNAVLVFVNIDRFERINRDHGRRAGDALLVEIAERIAKVARPDDTVARVGTDEFALLCEDLHSVHDVAEIVRQVSRTVSSRPFLCGSCDVPVTVRVDAVDAMEIDYSRGYYYTR